MQYFSRGLIAVIIVLGLSGIGYLWWQKQQAAQPAPIAAVPVPSSAPVVQAVPTPAASEPANYPIEAVAARNAASAPLPPIDAQGDAVRDALIGLLGRQQVLSFFDLDDFARRFVATVDNLARPHAAARLWPVVPAPARFLVQERDGVPYIAKGNADRYAAFVRFASGIDTGGAVALYVRMYPMLQKAYEDLGYPGKSFNNRMVEVIDQLLATPEPEGPIALTLTKVQGPIEVKRPWVRYEYADPDLQARSAGQKILMRMGVPHTRALKAKLRELRSRIAGRVGG
jgi:hypothetical protein